MGTKIKDQPAHYVKPDINCGGQETEGYWRQFLECDDHECVVGIGRTKEQAEFNAEKERTKHDTSLKQRWDIRLEKLINQDQILSSDMEKCILIIGKQLIQIHRSNQRYR